MSRITGFCAATHLTPSAVPRPVPSPPIAPEKKCPFEAIEVTVKGGPMCDCFLDNNRIRGKDFVQRVQHPVLTERFLVSAGNTFLFRGAFLLPMAGIPTPRAGRTRRISRLDLVFRSLEHSGKRVRNPTRKPKIGFIAPIGKLRPQRVFAQYSNTSSGLGVGRQR